MRPVVSYDDIAKPDSTPQLGPPLPSTTQPAAKKRRIHQKAPQRRAPQHIQHWDDPGNDSQAMKYDDSVVVAAETEELYEVEEEESRELTCEEIWDDSALIDAWNSATAEYESYHGKTKKWKEEPVKKSPLWYNVPKNANNKSNEHASDSANIAAAVETENADSTPIDFETYVPTHDPSLPSTAIQAPNLPGVDYAQDYLQNTSAQMVSQDEAFSRALSAMYWAGYWTSMYHAQRSFSQGRQEANTDEQAGGDEQGDEEEDAFVSTQR